MVVVLSGDGANRGGRGHSEDYRFFINRLGQTCRKLGANGEDVVLKGACSAPSPDNTTTAAMGNGRNGFKSDRIPS